MTRTRRATALVVAAAATVLAAAVLFWSGVDRLHTGRSDFTSTYVGATLLRQGHGDRLYDEPLQAPLHARLIAPDHEGNLPYVNPPPAALLALPFTALDLATAYRAWSLLQLLLLAAAVVVAARAAPWPAGTPRRVVVAAGMAALAGTGTVSLLLLGQWDGLSALGLACAYASWRRGRSATGGAWLAVTALVAKPHLALGLAAWLVARRDRRALAGAAAGVVAVAAVSLTVAGPSGTAGFVHAALLSSSRWPLRTMLGFTGLAGSWLGDTAAARLLASVASVAALAAAATLGAAVRRSPERLEASLAGATALSLLAAPHLLGHDLVLLAPAAAWCLARAATSDATARRCAWPGPTTLRVLLGWAAFNLVALTDLGNGTPAPPGRLVPWALLAAAGVAVATVRPRRRAVPAPA